MQALGRVGSRLHYTWKVNGQPAGNRELFEFRGWPVGTHRVEVTASAPWGKRARQEWTVEVLAARPLSQRKPVWSPRLAVLELSDEIGKDPRVLTLTGKVRNVDERSAEDIVVWVTAPDGQGRPLVRRLSFPRPQPLAPGQVGTFQVFLPSRDSISRFHVEVRSK